MSSETRVERVRQLLTGARTLRDPGSALGRIARTKLQASTGLSHQNVTWALEHALETDASDGELEQLCARTPIGARANVLLSANVFVAALRAIAIGLACASRVFVRASRREPVMARLLREAAPGLFEVVERLEPEPGDHCWVYGSDATIAEVARTWPSDVRLHAHGSGYGVVALDSTDLSSRSAIESIACGVATDVAAFDQRGCLSPRVVLVAGDAASGEALALALAEAMTLREQQVPIGLLAAAERAEVRRFHDTLCVAGRVLVAGTGLVTLETSAMPWVLPPVGRVVHVRIVRDAMAELREHARDITSVGIAGSNTAVRQRLQQALPTARVASIGRMQCPPLDGPVDLRERVRPCSH